MERYEKYKDSCVEWIGEIPEGLEVKRFKYLFDLITDKAEENLPKIGLENILNPFFQVPVQRNQFPILFFRQPCQRTMLTNKAVLINGVLHNLSQLADFPWLADKAKNAPLINGLVDGAGIQMVSRARNVKYFSIFFSPSLRSSRDFILK